MIRTASWPAFSGGSRRTGSISPAPRPPGQLVCGSTAAGSYSIKHGGQQEQHARDENRVAGQRDTKDSEHSASNQEQDLPAVRTASANRTVLPTRAGTSGPMPAGP
jgi:hypothetical protein